MSDPDEFDVYFAKAAAIQVLQESSQQMEESTRRGSLPDETSSSRLRAPSIMEDTDKHKRTFSCKVRYMYTAYFYLIITKLFLD